MAKIHELEGWIDGIQENIIDPNREIIDPHHHLWHGPKDPAGIKESYRYLLQDLWKDTSSGHNIKKTVFIDCGQEYYSEGPEQFKPVGETEFVVEIAQQAQEDSSQADNQKEDASALASDVINSITERSRGAFRARERDTR